MTTWVKTDSNSWVDLEKAARISPGGGVNFFIDAGFRYPGTTSETVTRLAGLWPTLAEAEVAAERLARGIDPSTLA